jgi:CTP synthase
MAKFIFVTGGVVSSLGKGIATSSIGLLLKSRGLKINLQKFDPYVNVDPGTMNPFQHGEVFVTEDGAETDLDLGHYERFIDVDLSSDNNLTTGQIYQSVIEKERQGFFLGGTIQIVPHITGEIKERIRKLSDNVAVIITEIGGTVGDIESLPFLEAARQMRLEEGKENVLYIHLTLVPYIAASCEYKTKPTQHSVKELRGIGIQPDIILCRTQSPLPLDAKEKIALFCNVQKEAVIEAVDTENIYEIPLIFHKQNLDRLIVQMLNLPSREPNLKEWENFIEKAKNPKATIEIGLCGKYVTMPDAYKSVIEAINHAATAQNLHANIRWMEAEDINLAMVAQKLQGLSGLIVPGGFGMRGMEGKAEAIGHVRENKIPFLGLCVGLQCAVVEFARNVCGMKGANSTEFDPNTKYPVIDFLPSQRRLRKKGGTMRLGTYPTILKKGTLAYKIYGKNKIFERHRHRYEVNPKYLRRFREKGLIASGISPKGDLAEIMEISKHPFFITTQFHPEFKSRALRPHPLFYAFIQASYEYHQRNFQIS